MYSVLMTGYMFKNVQYRLELQQSLEQVSLPEPKDPKVVFLLSILTNLKVTAIIIPRPKRKWEKQFSCNFTPQKKCHVGIKIAIFMSLL